MYSISKGPWDKLYTSIFTLFPVTYDMHISKTLKKTKTHWPIPYVVHGILIPLCYMLLIEMQMSVVDHAV